MQERVKAAGIGSTCRLSSGAPGWPTAIPHTARELFGGQWAPKQRWPATGQGDTMQGNAASAAQLQHWRQAGSVCVQGRDPRTWRDGQSRQALRTDT